MSRTSRVAIKRKFNVKPDLLDSRDYLYKPTLKTPQPEIFPDFFPPVKDQQDTQACTGFALSTVIEYLLRKAKRPEQENDLVSQFMLYFMARRYDEFLGEEDTGSSLRGALKAWRNHGACLLDKWSDCLDEPQNGEWWYEAVTRPLGVYYAINPLDLDAMQNALNEVGVIFASLQIHSGWNMLLDLPHQIQPKSYQIEIATIPIQSEPLGGHAIAILGYNKTGFLIQNSWGTEWGNQGYAVLSYKDWLANAMDAWVAQLGVVTQAHMDIASTQGTFPNGKIIGLNFNSVLDLTQINPFIINTGAEGELSNRGKFHTTRQDVELLFSQYLADAKNAWYPGQTSPTLDICFFAHGGLVSEDDAGKNARDWIPSVFNQGVFPVFLSWESGFWDALAAILNGTDRGNDSSRTGFSVNANPNTSLKTMFLQRLEESICPLGTEFWSKMKNRANSFSSNSEGGGQIVLKALLTYLSDHPTEKINLHFVGHSAGSILIAYWVDALIKKLDKTKTPNLSIRSLHFLAPAIRLDLFNKILKPHFEQGQIPFYQQWHLKDEVENVDPCFVYTGGSLLYLVSRSFEGNVKREGDRVYAPLMGMEKFAVPNLVRLRKNFLNSQIKWFPHLTFSAPSSSQHGEMGGDAGIRQDIISTIKYSLPAINPDSSYKLGFTPSKQELKQLVVGERHTVSNIIFAQNPENNMGIWLEKKHVYKFEITILKALLDDGIPATEEGFPWYQEGLTIPQKLVFLVGTPLKREPSENWFVLLGRIGVDGKVFSIGNLKNDFIAENSGELSCFVNDANFPFFYNNNSGQLKLIITRVK